jgi:hypothetical protein
MVRRDQPDGDDVVASTITVSAAIAMTGLKLRRQRVGKVAEIVGQECVDQREVGVQRRLDR